MATKKEQGGAKAPVYLVCGNDDLTALRKAEEIVAGLCPPEEQAFGLETIVPGGEEKTADVVAGILKDTMQALLTAPFLGGRKTVYLKGAPFFDPLTDPGRFADVKAATARMAEIIKAGLPEGVSFVLLTSKINKSTTFYKTFQSLGQVWEFNEATQAREASATFLPRLDELLEAKGLKMRGDAHAAFVGRVGYNLRLAESEIEKLSLYLGDRTEVTVADVQRMVASYKTSAFWEFANAFCTTNLTTTLDVLRRLLAQNESPVALLVNLQNTLRDMTVLSDCLTRGWAKLAGDKFLRWQVPPEGEDVLGRLASDPRKMAPFRVAQMASRAARLPAGRWFRWYNAAVDLQVAMTGGENMDAGALLELFTIRTLAELKAGGSASRTP